MSAFGRLWGALASRLPGAAPAAQKAPGKREAHDMVRAYAAAQITRLSEWNPSASSAVGEVSAGAKPLLRRARDAVRNDPYAARIVDLWAANAVGAGITTRWPDDARAAAWKVWSESTECDLDGHLNLAGIQALVMRATVESGGALVRLVATRPTRRNPVGLRLQVLEIDHLDSGRWRTPGNGNTIFDGVEVDAFGTVVAYWMFPTHPAAPWSVNTGSRESIRVPVGELLHVFRKQRPGQIRGVSWLAPVLVGLRDLGDYAEALLMKAKIEACLAAIVNADDGDGATDAVSNLLKDADGNTVETFTPGMIMYRRGTGSVDIVNPSGSGSHEVLFKRGLEGAGVGTGLTYDMLSGDLSEANYSSLRAGKTEFRSLNEQLQYSMLIPMLADPIAERFHANGALLGLWPVRVDGEISHVPPAPQMVDPLKDTLALIQQVRAGFVPPQEAAGLFGYPFDWTVAQIVAANKAYDDGGIIADTDPRRVARSGGAQDAAQLAAVEIAATGSSSSSSSSSKGQ